MREQKQVLEQRGIATQREPAQEERHEAPSKGRQCDRRLRIWIKAQTEGATVSNESRGKTKGCPGRVLNREQGTYKAERKRERERDKV